VINLIASRQRMEESVLNSVHQIRELRNRIVHRNLSISPIGFGVCKSRLATYVSRLPRKW